MSAPLFVLEQETLYSIATPKITGSFNAVAGDVLVAYALTALNTTTVAITNNGVALTWDVRQAIAVAGYGWLGVWTTKLTQSRAGLTVTFTATGGGSYGGDVLLFRGSDGIGATAGTNIASGAPALNLTTTTANSAVVVVIVDVLSVDGASRVWLTNAGAFSETTYNRVAGTYTVYGGYHANAGTAALSGLGLSTPGAQKYTIAAVEVLGQTPPLIHAPSYMQCRS